MPDDALHAQRAYLAQLLDALQRCAYFLGASIARLSWPLDGTFLAEHKKDATLFETLAAVNERFAKLQDLLGAAMKHSALLMAEPTSSFLQVLALFDRLGVIDQIDDWHRCRAARNLAAHDYDTEYTAIAVHFNTLHGLYPTLLGTASRLLAVSADRLRVVPSSGDFADEFARLMAARQR